MKNILCTKKIKSKKIKEKKIGNIEKVIADKAY